MRLFQSQKRELGEPGGSALWGDCLPSLISALYSTANKNHFDSWYVPEASGCGREWLKVPRFWFKSFLSLGLGPGSLTGLLPGYHIVLARR